MIYNVFINLVPLAIIVLLFIIAYGFAIAWEWAFIKPEGDEITPDKK